MSVKSQAPKPFTTAEGKDKLSEMLDFGPEPTPEAPSADFNERIRRIIDQLQEINQRIDRLSSNF